VGCRTHINTAKLGQHLLLLLQTITRHCWLCARQPLHVRHDRCNHMHIHEGVLRRTSASTLCQRQPYPHTTQGAATMQAHSLPEPWRFPQKCDDGEVLVCRPHPVCVGACCNADTATQITHQHARYTTSKCVCCFAKLHIYHQHTESNAWFMPHALCLIHPIRCTLVYKQHATLLPSEEHSTSTAANQQHVHCSCSMPGAAMHAVALACFMGTWPAA
jgi:hypothetical protein